MVSAVSIPPFSTVSGMFEHLDGLEFDDNVPEASLYLRTAKQAFLKAPETLQPKPIWQKLITEMFAVKQ